MAQPLMFQLNTEEEGQLRDLQTSRALAESMLKQAGQMPQGQMVSGHFVRPSIFQMLQPVVSGYLGRESLKQVNADEAKVRQGAETRGKADYAAGIENFEKTYATDPKKALAEAAASQHPLVQAFGKTRQAAWEKEQDREGRVLRGLLGRNDIDPQSAIAAAQGDMSKLKPVEYAPPKEVRGRDGELLAYTQTGPQGRLDVQGIPRGQTINVTNRSVTDLGNKAGSENLQNAFNRLAKSYDEKVLPAQQKLASTNRSLELMREGIRTGAGSDVIQGMASWLESAGFKKPSNLTQATEIVLKEILPQVSASAKQLGTNPTDLDYMRQLRAINPLNVPPEALIRVLEIQAKQQQFLIAQHERDVDKSIRAFSAFGGNTGFEALRADGATVDTTGLEVQRDPTSLMGAKVVPSGKPSALSKILAKPGTSLPSQPSLAPQPNDDNRLHVLRSEMEALEGRRQQLVQQGDKNGAQAAANAFAELAKQEQAEVARLAKTGKPPSPGTRPPLTPARLSDEELLKKYGVK